MSGYDDMPEWKRNRINKFAEKRAGMEEGSNEWNRMTNKINRWTGQGGFAWSDNFRKPFGNQNTKFQKSLKDGGFDTSKFDVTNKAEVLALQKQLFPNQFNEAGEDQWDGVFGDNTLAAYQNMVNQNRVNSGQEAYQYENSPGTVGGDQGSADSSSMYSPGGFGVSNMSGSGPGSGDVNVPGNNQHTMNSGNTINTGQNQNQNQGQSWWDWGSSVLNNLWD